MAETDESTRCPRGHLTAAGYQFCTTCGERVAPEPLVRDVPPPPPAGDAIGFALPPDLEAPAGDAPAEVRKRGRLRGGIGRGRKKPTPPPETPLGPSLVPSDIERPAGEPVADGPPAGGPAEEKRGVRRRVGAGRLRRKPDVPEPPSGPSLLLADVDEPAVERVENEPSRIAPPEHEPPASSAPLPASVYGDVEFAIGPGTKSVVTYGRPEAAAVRPSAGGKLRLPDGIPTRALIAMLVGVVAVATAIVLFVVREPGTPAAVSTSIPTAESTRGASAAPVASPVVVSEECSNSFAFAAAHAAEAQAPVLQQRTLTLCGSSREWLAAARLHPAAIGATDASQVAEDDLARVCAGAPGAGVCTTLSPPPSAVPSAATSTAAASPAPSP